MSKVITGVDLVYLPRFKKALKNGGEKFLRRVYLTEELNDQRLSRLAGIFAAKEAAIKALSLSIDSWHDIHIKYKSNGAPTIEISNFGFRISDFSLSISHDGNYVIAQFVALIK